ncbi:MAG: PLP-dependent aminotransferase family protein [Solirubrobacterales bacterium]|nr:PLP-dependent aminotransferase family protein [Solirubrobacterales bacterium]
MDHASRERDPAGDGPPTETGRHRRPHSTASDLQRYAGLFAARTRVMRSSAMRDLMEITARPEVISLAGGLPDTSTFPPESFAAQMTRIAQESAAKALQYGPTEGFGETKDVICEVMREEGMDPGRDDVLVTTGGQQAIDLICKALIDPGDVVIAEGPTYPGAVPTFCSYEADTRQVEMDDEGMRIDALEELLAELEREGRRPKFIYSVPTFQNPGGVTMSLERRQRLVRIAREREILVIEDNPYGLLRFGGEPPIPLYSLDGGDYVLYVGTLSKILSPGIRIGWVCAPPPVMAKLVLGKGASDLCTSTLSQYFVREYFGEGRWREYVAELSRIYSSRRNAMIEALERYFPPQATWSEPEGGLFLWATLPDYIDTTDLLAKALRDNVAFVPGEAAYTDGRGSGSMRLNYSAQSEDEIREGVRRIGAVIDEQVTLYETMTGEHRVVDPNEAREAARGDSGSEGEGAVLPFHRRPPEDTRDGRDRGDRRSRGDGRPPGGDRGR